MNDSQLSALFQDLNQRLFEAFQQLGIVLRDLKLQLDDIQGTVSQTTGARPAPAANQVSADDLQQGFKAIGQRLALIAQELGDLKAGGTGTAGPNTLLTDHLSRLSGAVDQSVRAALKQFQDKLDEQRLQELQSQPDLEPRLAALNTGLERLALQLARVGDSPAPDPVQIVRAAVEQVEKALELQRLQDAEAAQPVNARLESRLEALEQSLRKLTEQRQQLERIATTLSELPQSPLPEALTSGALVEWELRLSATLEAVRGSLEQGHLTAAAELRRELEHLTAKVGGISDVLREQADRDTPDPLPALESRLGGLDQRLSGVLETLSRVQSRVEAEPAPFPELVDFGQRLDRFVNEIRDSVTSIFAAASRASATGAEASGTQQAAAAAEGMSGVQQQVTALAARVDELLPRLVEHQAAPASEGSFAPAAARFDALETSLTGIRELIAAVNAHEERAQAFAALEARLDTLSTRIETLAPVDPGPALEALALTFDARLQRLESMLPTTPPPAEPQPEHPRMAVLEVRLSGLETGIGDLRSMLEQALARPAAVAPAAPAVQPGELAEMRAALAALTDRLDQLQVVDPAPAIQTLAVNVHAHLERLEKLARPEGEGQQLDLIDRKMDALDRRFAALTLPPPTAVSVSGLAATLERRLDQLESVLRAIPALAAETAPAPQPVALSAPAPVAPPRPVSRTRETEPDLDSLLLD